MTFLSSENLLSLASLTAMEIVLGIDNVVFIAIVSQNVAENQRRLVRRLGLALALVMRLALLFALSWLMGLTRTLFSVLGNEISGRDLVLLGGGLFLIAKSVHEIYEKLEAAEEGQEARRHASFASTLAQILALDVIFSLDSVITAVGMAREIWVMVVAMVAAVGVMLASADKISVFVHRHPSMKILALSFLLLIGVLLVAEGLGQHINKGYIYFSMAFALLVEILNMRVRRRSAPVVLHEKFSGAGPTDQPPAV